VLEEIVASCEEKAVIDTGAYDQEVLADDARRARIYAETQYPLGVYAVDWMSVRLGKSDGRSVLTVHVRYIHNRTAIQEIKQVHSEKSASFRIYDAMEQYASRLALWVKSEEEINYHRIVEEYAWNAPRTVMECPDLTVETYPEDGTERIVVLNFDYQTGVDTLRSMRDQVIPVFDRALATAQKSEDPYRALYDFLMKGYNHHITPSITPSYSLLKYGVGDSKAFAQVYAAMCREAGMECLTVHGTKNGTSHCWNIIRVGNVYYHLDLLGGGYVLYSNATLTGYVWDYAAYPVCGAPIEE
jgi:transglutaminase/protease-like cytokinesis protein 3